MHYFMGFNNFFGVILFIQKTLFVIHTQHILLHIYDIVRPIR